MKQKKNFLIAALVGGLSVIAVSGCSSSKSDAAHSTKLKTALDQSSLSLKDAVTKAEAQEHLTSTKAQLITSGTSRFKIYLASANASAKEVDVESATGNVIASVASGNSSAPNCAGPTTTKDALAIAEQASGGRAVGIQPDDDDACLFEVQALNGATIWEVKIDRNGKVLEKEDVTNEVEDGEEAD